MLIDVILIVLFISVTIALPTFFGYISFRPHQLRNNRRGRKSQGVLVRLVAKVIDFGLIYAVLFALILLAFTVMFPSISTDILTINDKASSLIYMFFAFFFDTLIMGITGTTFGKWLLGIKVKRVNGQKIDLIAAFKRNVYVVIMFCGGFIPFVSNFTIARSYFYYKAMSQASWDVYGGTRVTRSSPSYVGLIVLIMVVGFLYLYYQSSLK